MPRTKTGPPLLVGVKRAAKHNRRGKQKQQKEATKTPLPPRVQRKGLRRVPGESQKRAGPRMAPRKNAKKRDARPKRANKQVRRDRKRNRKKQCKCVWGVPCYYLSCLSLKKETRTTTSAKKPKEERKQPKNTRPDIKRIF